MTKLPIHTLLDKDKKPFIPFITAKCIPLDGTSDTVYDRLESLNNKEVVQPSVATDVTAIYNYRTLPISDVAPTEANQLVNKQYVDDSITNVDVSGGAAYPITNIESTYNKPVIIEDLPVGIYRLQQPNTYIRIISTLSRRLINTMDGLLYIPKNYKDAQVGEAFLEYLGSNGRLYRFVKNDTSFSESNGGDNQILRIGYDYTINSIYTFSELPKTSIVPTENEQFTNKKYVDDTIANNAGPAIDESVLLHYKGHVASVEDLPSTGQPSGTLTDSYMGIDNSILGIDETAISAIKELVEDDYFLGVYNSPTDYLILSTADPEAFKSISFIKSGYGSADATTSAYVFVIVDESQARTVNLYCNGGRSIAYLKTPSGSDTLQPSENYRGTLTALKEIQLYAGANPCLYGNLPVTLDYVANPRSGIFSVNSLGNFWFDQCTQLSSLRLNFENNYVYTEGMQCLKSNGDGTLSWVLTDSIAIPNEVYTVGGDYQVYHCDNTPKWNRWNNTYSKSEIDEMLGNAEAVLTEVLEGTTV